MITFREERPGDEAAVDALTAAAFGRREEADLVAALRRAGDTVLSLVALDGTAIVGNATFSRLRVEPAGLKASALAPLSVAPGAQKAGIGSALVRQGLDRLREAGEDVVLVLGDPDWYGRFGFSAGAARSFATPWDGAHQQALWLAEAGRFRVRYAPAFDALA